MVRALLCGGSFPEALQLLAELKPKAVMLENVRELLDSVFDEYRTEIISKLEKLEYTADWLLLNASDYGVSQLRPKVIFVGINNPTAEQRGMLFLKRYCIRP